MIFLHYIFFFFHRCHSQFDRCHFYSVPCYYGCSYYLVHIIQFPLDKRALVIPLAAAAPLRVYIRSSSLCSENQGESRKAPDHQENFVRKIPPSSFLSLLDGIIASRTRSASVNRKIVTFYPYRLRYSSRIGRWVG